MGAADRRMRHPKMALTPPGRQAAAEPTGVGVRDWQRRERFAGGGS